MKTYLQTDNFKMNKQISIYIYIYKYPYIYIYTYIICDHQIFSTLKPLKLPR